MADNKRWFKVWTNLLTDPVFDDIHNPAIGAWVRLGALIALHGESGKIEISKTQLLKRMHLQNVEEIDLKKTVEELKKLDISIDLNCNGTCFVSFNDWSKKQTDWNSYERVKKHRETARETVQDKKKIRSRKEVDKNKEKKNIYMSFVYLSDEEHKKLLERFGETDTLKRIERLDNYLGSTGKRYRSHYHTILNWASKEDKKPWEE